MSENAPCACCLDDRSWTCILLANVVFGLIAGCIAALIVTQTSLITHFKPTPYHPPNTTFTVDYLWQGYRYHFYKTMETYEDAKKICEYHNTSLLVFDSNQEEKELDCYLNARNNAEEQQLSIWINETFLFGGPFMYARPASFFSDSREAVVLKANKIIEENGCDVQDNFEENQALWTEDQQNSEAETTYFIEKLYGNHGLRGPKQGSTNGCWNFVRFNLAKEKKNFFICRSINPTVQGTTTTTSLSNFQRHQFFSEKYC
jgi:hypothetical protein